MNTTDLPDPNSRIRPKPPWHAVPNDLPLVMERAGLDAGTRDLNHAAWGYASSNRTDGFLSLLEARRLPSWSPQRAGRLARAGFWAERDGGYEIVGYLDINDTKAVIDEKRANNRARQERFRGRRARADDEDDKDDDQSGGRNALRNGSYPYPSPTPPLPDTRELGSREAAANVEEERAETTGGSARERSAPKDVSGVGGTAKARVKVTAIPDFEDDRWQAVSEAWFGRNLREPPSRKQLGYLWPIALEFPEEIAGWIGEAPCDGNSTFGIVAYVREAARSTREDSKRRRAVQAPSLEKRIDTSGWTPVVVNGYQRWLDADGVLLY